MKRLSDNAIKILNGILPDNLDYRLEYLPILKALTRLEAYENTGLEPKQVRKTANVLGQFGEEYNCWFNYVADFMCKYAQAEREGKLVVLPVPVGDGKLVYGIYDTEPLPAHIVTIECDYLDGLEIFPSGEIVVKVDGWEIGESDIGDTVFLTREEAEAAMEAREGGEGGRNE